MLILAQMGAEGVVEHEEARALPPPTWVEMGHCTRF
jgi:hypothetical protein